MLPSRFVAYGGEVIEGVGLYIGKSGPQGGEEGVPSLRYLRLMQNGAREAGLSEEWTREGEQKIIIFSRKKILRFDRFPCT